MMGAQIHSPPSIEALIHAAGGLGISATEEAFGLVEDQDRLHGTCLWQSDILQSPRGPWEIHGKSIENHNRNGGFNR